MVSQTYLAVVISVLGAVLPKIGVTLGNDELTTFVSVIITIGGGIWALVRRYQGGGVNVLGLRK